MAAAHVSAEPGATQDGPSRHDYRPARSLPPPAQAWLPAVPPRHLTGGDPRASRGLSRPHKPRGPRSLRCSRPASPRRRQPSRRLRRGGHGFESRSRQAPDAEPSCTPRPPPGPAFPQQEAPGPSGPHPRALPFATSSGLPRGQGRPGQAAGRTAGNAHGATSRPTRADTTAGRKDLL
ncbi:uncharacterized protein LOC110396041 [Numida meleagris]|uniref:uncharacterized protein LOC110396041 n=1 Tax=Numida meleagris TaxID=8996 RepID=UPI000B3DAA95|nr:uncharacterized protein LOC110396041 [Numida meleagris]